MVACQQAVLTAGWLLAVMVMRADRRAALHWAAYAAVTGVSLVLFVCAARTGSQGLRALGTAGAVLGMLLLHRGVRRFVGHRPGWWPYAGALALASMVSWLGMRPGLAPLRVAVVSALLAVYCWMTACEVSSHARTRLRMRWGVLPALPLYLGSAAFAWRCLFAVFVPEHVVIDITENTPWHLFSAVLFLLSGLVFHLALAGLVGARLVTELRRLSRHDGLTELLNRGAMQESLDQEARRAARDGKPFAVLMLDADHFKAINDTHGHAAGDSALRYLASLLRSQMRDVDQLGRVGGEEFLVLLPDSTVAQAVAAAQRIREAMLRQPHQWQGRALPVTLSIGVAAWQGAADEISLLLRRADAALYKAKARGRDCVVAPGAGELSADAATAIPGGS